MTTFLRAHALALTAIAAACAAVGLIWLPVGHAMIGLIEEWDILALFQDHGVFFLTTAHSPLPITEIRPLNIAPMALAYVLGPNSFLSWHLLLALSLAGKAIGMTVLARWLLRDRWIAVGTGLLFLFYPADTMQMSLRGLHIDWSVTFDIIGLALFVTATDAERPGSRWLLSALAGAAFATGGFTYEANLFLAPAPLLLWWARYGSVEGLRKQLVPLAVWFFFFALNVAYIASVLRHGGGDYQQGLAATSTPLPAVLAQRGLKLFTVGMYREYLDGWYDAARMLAGEPSFWPYLAVLVLVLLGSLLALTSRGTAIHRLAAGRLGRTLLVGFALACLGYLPYLAAESHISITQRTHLVSAIGGALTVGALIQAVSSRWRALSFACWTVALAIGLGAQWRQMDHYTTLSLRERMLLAGIAQAAPDLAEGQQVLIIDRSGQLESTWMMRGGMLQHALSYLYNHHVVPEVCVEPGPVWADYTTNAQGSPGRCVEGSSSWDLGVGVAGEMTLPKAGLVTLVIAADGVVQRQGAPAPFAPTAAEAKRWRGILGCWPASACRYEPPRASAYRYDWGTWWSLEEAPWGAGWLDTGWDPPAWSPRSSAWMSSPQARLWVPLRPTGGAYRLRVRFYRWITPAARDSLSISVNGNPLHLYRGKHDMAIAMVPADDLLAGLNDVTFSARLDPKSGISGAMDWMDLTPAAGRDAGLVGAADWAPPQVADETLGPNAVISFIDHGNAATYSGAGWWRESDGAWTWTEGADSDLKLTLQPSATGYQLVFDLLPYLSKPVPVRTVQVSANGRTLDRWTFDRGDWATRIVHVPPDLTGAPIVLHLHQNATPSPKDLGLGADPRHVGLGVKTITVKSGG